jgi:hypothetical protein
MARALFGIDNPKDMGSGGSKNVGYFFTSWLSLTTASLTCCCDNKKNTNYYDRVCVIRTTLPPIVNIPTTALFNKR